MKTTPAQKQGVRWMARTAGHLVVMGDWQCQDSSVRDCGVTGAPPSANRKQVVYSG